ncbi:hypothetical protein PG991_006597 [Apiospora marii]|uniref:C2H2-type domain-containing protein n=1 Tax=Apiospora marii TaxID=335849 RepID=A0ABR1RZP2_9PEZI
MAPNKKTNAKKAPKSKAQSSRRSRPSRSSRRLQPAQTQPVEPAQQPAQQPAQPSRQPVPPPPRADLAWARNGFHGTLIHGGRYVQCGLPPLRPQNPDHHHCLARIRNTARALQSHFGKEHVAANAHARDTEKHADRPFECADSCGYAHQNWTSHLAHIRGPHHQWRGSAARIKKAGGVKKARGTIDPNTNKIILPPEDDIVGEGEDDEDDLPEDQPFWEGHGNGGQGPSGGAAGGLIAAA